MKWGMVTYTTRAHCACGWASDEAPVQSMLDVKQAVQEHLQACTLSHAINDALLLGHAMARAASSTKYHQTEEQQ